MMEKKSPGTSLPKDAAGSHYPAGPDADDCPGPAGSAGFNARFGPWLVLIWPPLLLGGPAVAAAQENQWLQLCGLTGVALAFTTTMLAHYRKLPGLGRHRTSSVRGLFLLQAGLTTALLAPVAGESLAFLVLPLLAIAAGVVFGPWTATVAVVLMTTGAALLLASRAPLEGLVWLAVTTVLSGFGTFVVHRLGETVAELHHARQELARSAVAAERLRFSRDLHDLLGHTLSVIVVKAEAVRRLAEADPPAAAAHGADIEQLGRSALIEVRQAVAGYRSGGLGAELDQAARALGAAGINVEISAEEPAPDRRTQELLSWVVREGATNVLRHGRAGSCSITVATADGQTRLAIENDGGASLPHPVTAGTEDSASGRSGRFGASRSGTGGMDNGSGTGGMDNGSGLRGLSERIHAVGGSLNVGPAGGGFRLEAKIPANPVNGAAAR